MLPHSSPRFAIVGSSNLSKRLMSKEELVDVFNSYKKDWKLSDEHIHLAAETAFDDGIEELDADSAELLYFLYAKGISFDTSKWNRTTKFYELFKNDFYKSALIGLRTIVKVGEKSPMKDGTIPHMRWKDFVEKHREWGVEGKKSLFAKFVNLLRAPKPKVFVVFRDHKDLKGTSCFDFD